MDYTQIFGTQYRFSAHSSEPRSTPLQQAISKRTPKKTAGTARKHLVKDRRPPPGFGTARHSSNHHHDQGTPTDLPGLSAEAKSRLNRAIEGGIATSTAQLYKRGVEAFHAFCNKEKIPAAQRLPASEQLLAAFAAGKLGSAAGSSVRNAITAVRSWHSTNGAPWMGSDLLARVLRGTENLAPPSSRKPPRKGVSSKMLAAVARHLNLCDPFDIAVIAAATTVFWTQARLGELLPETLAAEALTKIPKRGHLGPLSTSGRSQQLHLPWTKTKRSQGDYLIITRQPGDANPLPTLELHLNSNNPPADGPLFSYKTQDGSLRPLTKRAFLQRFNTAAAAGGFPRITGHAFRIGGTTELLCSGVAPDVVKRMGRWASDSFLRYWRKSTAIGEAHIADLWQKRRRRC